MLVANIDYLVVGKSRPCYIGGVNNPGICRVRVLYIRGNVHTGVGVLMTAIRIKATFGKRGALVCNT